MPYDTMDENEDIEDPKTGQNLGEPAVSVEYKGKLVNLPCDVELKMYAEAQPASCAAMVVDSKGQVIETFWPELENEIREDAEAAVLRKAESLVGKLVTLQERAYLAKTEGREARTTQREESIFWESLGQAVLVLGGVFVIIMAIILVTDKTETALLDGVQKPGQEWVAASREDTKFMEGHHITYATDDQIRKWQEEANLISEMEARLYKKDVVTSVGGTVTCVTTSPTGMTCTANADGLVNVETKEKEVSELKAQLMDKGL